MSLFNNITIIGLGLIGSSIARAVRQHNICQTITAFDIDEQSIQQALELAIIDNGTTSLSKLDNNTDLIILCTPIGTYKSIIEQLSPSISNNTIITDVGSVKQGVIDDICNSLTEEQFANFIPAHPIAGSEKSGVSAGKADLFKDKKLIITPTSSSSAEAIDKMQQLWRLIGSDIVVMSANEHDAIYAATSHTPQLISFCYAKILSNFLGQNVNEIIAQQGDEFASFMRLSASSANMWADILLFNKKAVISNIDNFFGPPSLASLNSPADIDQLAKRLQAAKETRGSLQPAKNYNQPINSNKAIIAMLPRIIACIIIESVKDLKHVGSGFLGITENILTINNNAADLIQANQLELNDAIDLLTKELLIAKSHISNGSRNEIMQYINTPAL